MLLPNGCRTCSIKLPDSEERVKANVALRSARRHKYAPILDRWTNDGTYRESQLACGRMTSTGLCLEEEHGRMPSSRQEPSPSGISLRNPGTPLNCSLRSLNTSESHRSHQQQGSRFESPFLIWLGENLSETRLGIHGCGATTASGIVGHLGARTTGARHCRKVILIFLSNLLKWTGHQRWQSSSDRRKVQTIHPLQRHISSVDAFIAHAHTCTQFFIILSAWLKVSSGFLD